MDGSRLNHLERNLHEALSAESGIDGHAEHFVDGIEVSVPQNADPYLHDKFGDYMTLPNLDELHPHADNIEFYDDETSR